MRCPFKKDVIEGVVRPETVFGYCYKEECMAYRVIAVSENKSVCYCALTTPPPVPYVFGGCYDGND